MHEGMQYDLIQNQGHGHEPFKVGNRPFSKAISAIYNGSWQLTTDTVSNFDRAGFLIFGLVLVLRDFEVGTNVSCEESTVSACTALIYPFYD